MENLVTKARIFAIAAHTAVGQLRKYTNAPYWVHPEEVAKIVSTVPGVTPEMIAAAWLHDVVEDTAVPIHYIQQEFGDEVSSLVGWLTDVSRPEHGNRAARKAIDRAHTAMAPAKAQTIKLADLISNTRDIVQNDIKFAKIYLQEKGLLLPVLNKGDSTLFQRATEQLVEGLKKIQQHG